MQSRRPPSCFNDRDRIASLSVSGAYSRRSPAGSDIATERTKATALRSVRRAGGTARRAYYVRNTGACKESANTVMQPTSELDNFQELARVFIPTPGDIPNVS